MMALSLYEIDQQYQEAIDRALALAEETDGIVEEALSDDIDSLYEQREAKIINTAHYIKNCRAEAEAIKLEERRLADRRKRLENSGEWGERYLASILDPGEKYAAPTAAISWRASASTVIDNADAIPSQYVEVVTERKIDKNGIKAAIKSGVEITGAHVETKQTIQIK